MERRNASFKQKDKGNITVADQPKGKADVI